MSHLAYFRVSTTEQSIASQRAAIASVRSIDKEFIDEGVSGAIIASKRPGFSSLLSYVRAGDTIHVTAIDRLGRDAIDIQMTIRTLLTKGVSVEIMGLGTISSGVGELIVAVLAQVADMERQRIIERTSSGRELAKKTLFATGKTHRGKSSMGRPLKADSVSINAWRTSNNASIRQTAHHFELSESTIKRYIASKQPK